MALKDNYLWQEYKKLVSRIRDNNKVVSTPSPKIPIQRKREKLVERNISLPQAPIARSNCKKTNLMSRLEKRKFKEEGVIDLHGATKADIEPLLIDFFNKCLAQNIRNVVIITGKGNGIIRQETHDFLLSTPNYIVSFAPIFDIGKGSGSFAVRLRKI